jgi:diguanylate cyclase (GGDEF)-like protein
VTVKVTTDIDIASRYGGEEFIIIMPDTGPLGAAVAAERIRATIEGEVGQATGLVTPGGQPLRITGSFGVAAFEKGEDLEALIKRADDAVYRAKASGKNRVVVWEP